MKRLNLLALLLTLFLMASAAHAADWNLVYENDFEKGPLGPEWILSGTGEIKDGAFVFGTEKPDIAVLDKSFAPDVKVRMMVESYPGKPPCDLSIGLACSADPRPSYGYLLAFGGMSNTGHQIIGGGDMKVARVKYVDNVIEPGQVYTVEAIKDGKDISLVVDGEVVLHTVDNDVLGGPGYDKIALVTWNGMIVHEVQVFERATRNPDTPVFLDSLQGLRMTENDEGKLIPAPGEEFPPDVAKAAGLYNEGKYKEAEKAFLAIDDITWRAAGEAYTVGNVNYIEKFEDNLRAGALLEELATANPTDKRYQNYGVLGQEIARMTILRGDGLPKTGVALKRILAAGPKDNPYYDKARFYKARFLRASAMEGANSKVMQMAKNILNDLYEKYPDNPSLVQLTGHTVPWGEDLINDDESVPLWARASRELYARQAAVLNEWFTNRQLPDGQLGGGWGDDVEILRSWGPVAFISDADPEILEGIERLSEGVWQSQLTQYGFSPSIGDVEHAAEPSADTVPTMLVLRYGDPLWIERDMLSCRSIRDIYTGIDDKGYRRFKSSYYGGGEAGQGLRDGGDSHYNTRTMKHMWWLAWYGNKGARDVYLDWVRGWLAATMLETPSKPAGVVPGAVWWPDGGIVPPGGEHWYDDLGQYDAGGPSISYRIQSAFMAAYTLTGDRSFFAPMQFFTRWTAYGPLVDKSDTPNPDPGSFLWNVRGLQYTTGMDAMTQYWWLSNDQAIEEYIMRFASPMQRYLIKKDVDPLINRISGSARHMRNNFLLMTKELLQTDRAGLPGAMESYGAFTGGFNNWRDNNIMTAAVSYDAPHTHFGALVPVATNRFLRVWLYNFGDKPVHMGLKLWRLDPGVYELRNGEILPGEDVNQRYAWKSFEPELVNVRRRADMVYVDVPPGKPWAVDLAMRSPLEVPTDVPDPAIADRDLSLNEEDGRIDLAAVVHNVGLETATNIVVTLQVKDGDAFRDEATTRIRQLESPDDLMPRTQTVSFEDVPKASAYRIILDPHNDIDEIYEGNNVGTLTLE